MSIYTDNTKEQVVEREYLYDRFLPAFAAVMAGKMYCDVTGAVWLLNYSIPTAFFISVLSALMFILITLSIAAITWLGIRLIVGAAGRREFQATWAWIGVGTQAVNTLLLTFLVWDNPGVSFSSHEPGVHFFLVLIPYFLAFCSIKYLTEGRNAISKNKDINKLYEHEQKIREAPIRRRSNRIALTVSLTIWTIIVAGAALLDNSTENILLSVLVGAVLGFLIGGLVGGIYHAAFRQRYRH